MHSLYRSLQKEIKRVEKTYNGIDKLLNGAVDPLRKELKELYRDNFDIFCEDFWAYASTSSPLIKSYAFDALMAHLVPLFERKFKFLLFTCPPREGKSTIISVLWMAWIWLRNPSERILSVSYSDQLAKRDNRNMRNLILSPAYRQLFGDEFYLTETNRHKIANNLYGERIANSMDGHNTGQGGNIIVFDDPNSILDKAKPEMLIKANESFDNVFIHRQNDPVNTIMVVNQHRIGMNDFYNHILSKDYDDMVAVEVPFEFIESRRCQTFIPGSDVMLWKDPRKKDGDYINPVRHKEKEHQRIKKTMSPILYETLYQCNPVPEKGGVFERDWYKIWKSPILPDFDFVISSWDTALSTGPTASYSAMTSWGVFTDKNGIQNLLFLNSWHGKEEFTELLKMIARLYYNVHDTDKNNPHQGNANADILLIEGKANGLSIRDVLHKMNINAIAYDPPKMGTRMYGKNSEGKVLRARIASQMVEAGRVFVQANPHNYEEPSYISDRFIRACCNFPHNVEAARDIIDTFSMTIDYLTKKNYLKTKTNALDHGYDQFIYDIRKGLEDQKISNAKRGMINDYNKLH